MVGPTSATASSNTPMNVEQIVQQAQNYDYNPRIPLRHWLHAANNLLKEAEIYEHEGNNQQTYLLLFRHAQLVLGQLTQHPDVGPKSKAALAQAERDVKSGLAKMEMLKPRINKKYERYQRLLRDRAAMGIDIPTQRKKKKQQPSQPQRSASGSDQRFELAADEPTELEAVNPMDPAIAGQETLAAGENKDLAVELARKEIKRRAAAAPRKATFRAGISEAEEQERRTAGVWGSWDSDLSDYHQPGAAVDSDGLSKQMQNVRLHVDGSSREGRSGKQDTRPSYRPTTSSTSFNYPSIQPSKRVPKDNDTSWAPQRSKVRDKPDSFMLSLDQKPPPPPPKDELYAAAVAPPRRPAKTPLSISSSTSTPTTQSSSSTTATPEPSYTFKPEAYLENGTPLRTVFLHPGLRQTFLSLAEPNTRANLETCGILCGTLISNALFISRLVIPEQISTSDTCETKNEEALFDYVDREDLMVLGWIHTHPTQTCFMSSRDLHTHSGYQAMMPESIAIVCAPSKSDYPYGVFRLTDPPGLQAVLKCTQKGLFHPHEETHMYTEACKPGHVIEHQGLEYSIHDMRK